MRLYAARLALVLVGLVDSGSARVCDQGKAKPANEPELFPVGEPALVRRSHAREVGLIGVRNSRREHPK